MKKILLVLTNIILLILLIIVMKDGIKIGSFQVLSFKGISDLNEQLTQKINEANNYSNNYSESLTTLNNDITKLASAKKEYLDLVTISSESEIQQATQTKTYTIEYLWGKVGNYATKEGVNIKMDVVSSSIGNGSEYRNLNFTVSGNYLATTNFIYKLENDSDLDFTIDSFNMTNGKCTFVVKDVVIKQELTQSSTSSVDTSTTNNTTTSSTTSVSESVKKDADAISSTNKALEEQNL